MWGVGGCLGGGGHFEMSPLHMNHPEVILLVQQDITSATYSPCLSASASYAQPCIVLFAAQLRMSLWRSYVPLYYLCIYSHARRELP